MQDGFYRLYRLTHQGDETTRALSSRFLIYKGNIHHLEDHEKNMHKILPEGPLTPNILRRLASFGRSGYHEQVSEDDIDAGHHPHLIEKMDLGQDVPDQRYILNGPNQQPMDMEVWPDAVTLNGDTLQEEQLRHIMDGVQDGSLTLTPKE